MSDEQVLVNAILSNHYDAAPRLALADLLEENGHPALATLMRADVQLIEAASKELQFQREWFDWISVCRFQLAVRLGELLNQSPDDIWEDNRDSWPYPPPERWWEKNDAQQG